ncbi:hypothetical protein HK405_002002, partial [Cladochytrium tenue]
MASDSIHLPATFRAVRIQRAGGEYEVKAMPMPAAWAADEVLIKVEACGICF